MAEGGQVPTKIGLFNTFATRVVPFLANPANQARLGVSDDNKDFLVDAFGSSSTAGSWVYLWEKTSDDTTSTKPLRKQRNTVQKTITNKVREVYDDIPESALTEADRTTLLIPKRDKKPSERAAITTRPTLKLLVQGGARFIVENRVTSDSTRPSMHPAADYVEFIYCIQETPPTDPAECNKTKIFSKSRDVLQLDPAVGGEKMHCYSRWANKTDEAKSSPWTRLHSAVISD